MKEAYHKSTQEWEYYKFVNIEQAIKFLHKGIKSGRFHIITHEDIKFLDYGTEVGLGIMIGYDNN